MFRHYGPGFNSVFMLLCAFAAVCAAGCRSTAKAPPNIVLITLESLRPDHVEGLSGTRSTSPHLAALARESMVYDDAHSVTSWTLASHASIFTGLYPTAHRTSGPRSRLDDSYTTIAELLGQHGYLSAGVASGPYLRPPYNLNQGFEYYDDSPSQESHSAAHADVTNPAMEAAMGRFLDQRADPDRPFFLFAYFWDPHHDYVPPPPYDTMFVDEDCEPIIVTDYERNDAVNAQIRPAQLNYVRSQYDGEIRWTDDHLGRFFQRLKDDGLWDDTVVIVTADHGEAFFEHGKKGHKNDLYVEAVHVPLIVKYAAGGPNGTDSRLTSLVDLFATIAELAGVSTDVPHQGRSLLEPEVDPLRSIYYELTSIHYANRQVSDEQVWVGVRQGDHKLLAVPVDSRIELYNIREDPKETRNIARERSQLAQRMGRETTKWLTATRSLAGVFEPGGEAELDESMLERLRSLGYIQ